MTMKSSTLKFTSPPTNNAGKKEKQKIKGKKENKTYLKKTAWHSKIS